MPIGNPSAGYTFSPRAKAGPVPSVDPPAGAQTQPAATSLPVPIKAAPSADIIPRAAKLLATPKHPSPSGGILHLIEEAVEADPAFLALVADTVDDLEKVRIAAENRLRHLIRDVADSDGEVRGLGLDARNPHVRRIAAIVQEISATEHKAVLALQNAMRKHPLGPWVKAQVGIGEKQSARLLAAIGDPYIRPELVCVDGTVEPARPRMVSELWALCGLHVLPARQVSDDTHTPTAGGNQTGHPDQSTNDTHWPSVGVAPKRQKGQRANWSTTAKTRAYLIAESCIKQHKSPYRAVYDEGRAKYSGAVHQVPCVRCGPSGKPAEIGSPLSAGHQHARAMRLVAKAILRDLWTESKRLHESATPASTADGGR